jgi:hypothetical protein
MKRILAFAPILTVGLLFILQCGDNGNKPTAPAGSITYRRTDHYPCRHDQGKSKETTACAYLKTASFDGSSLALTIHFEANCCPSFVNTINVTDRTIEIAVADTLHECRCTCPYEDDFVFSCPTQGNVTVRFQTENGSCAFDTLIALRR